MISLDALSDLYEYNYWARDRQLEACAALSDEQILRPMGSSFRSLRDTLVHLLGAEWIWHERFCGRSPRMVPDWVHGLHTLESIQERWKGVELDLRSYITNLSADELPRPLSYVNLAGQSWTYPLWKTLVHLVNHQTYHRGQVTMFLRQLGAKPPAIDFLVYFDARL